MSTMPYIVIFTVQFNHSPFITSCSTSRLVLSLPPCSGSIPLGVPQCSADAPGASRQTYKRSSSALSLRARTYLLSHVLFTHVAADGNTAIHNLLLTTTVVYTKHGVLCFRPPLRRHPAQTHVYQSDITSLESTRALEEAVGAFPVDGPAALWVRIESESGWFVAFIGFAICQMRYVGVAACPRYGSANCPCSPLGREASATYAIRCLGSLFDVGGS